MRSARVAEGAAARPPTIQRSWGRRCSLPDLAQAHPSLEGAQEGAQQAGADATGRVDALGGGGEAVPKGVCELHRAAALPPLVNTPLTTTLKQTRHLNTNLTKNLQS